MSFLVRTITDALSEKALDTGTLTSFKKLLGKALEPLRQ